jgi:hypothetical protein
MSLQSIATSLQPSCHARRRACGPVRHATCLCGTCWARRTSYAPPGLPDVASRPWPMGSQRRWLLVLPLVPQGLLPLDSKRSQARGSAGSACLVFHAARRRRMSPARACAACAAELVWCCSCTRSARSTAASRASTSNVSHFAVRRGVSPSDGVHATGPVICFVFVRLPSRRLCHPGLSGTSYCQLQRNTPDSAKQSRRGYNAIPQGTSLAHCQRAWRRGGCCPDPPPSELALSLSCQRPAIDLAAGSGACWSPALWTM